MPIYLSSVLQIQEDKYLQHGRPFIDGVHPL